MIKRKIESDLERFFESGGSYALLIEGARQVGKTYIVERFAEKHYDVFIKVDFVTMKGAKAIFEDVEDEKDVLLRISAFTSKGIKRGRTLVFFDEIQECPEAVTFIKALVQEGGCHYILSGSLLGVEIKNIRSVPVGFMDEVKMYPLDFEEFVSACGERSEMVDEARRAWLERKPLAKVYHNRLLKLFRLYLVVGGMPAAVQSYLDTRDIMKVVREQKKILAMYRKDISKYDEKNALRIRLVFDRIPAELDKKNKRYYVSSIEAGERFENLEDEFVWLKEAGVAIPVYNVSEPKSPLVLGTKPNLFKLFSNDVGLLAAQYMNGIQLSILNGDKSINFGSIYENAVAQELKAHGIEPLYYNSPSHGELDFVVEQSGKVVPVEVKSGKHYQRHRALAFAMSVPEYEIETAIVFNDDMLAVRDKVYYAPIYMSMFLAPPPLPDKMIYEV